MSAGSKTDSPLPLAGKRVVVTRAQGQADALCERLRELGAEPMELATIEIRPALDYAPLDRAIANLESYGWAIFTSVNGVRYFMERMRLAGRDLSALRARICAIGPATRSAIERLGLKVDVMGKEYVAEGLLEAFAPYEMAGARVLLPRAAVARDLVPDGLAGLGAQVDVVEAYRTGIPGDAAARAREIFGGASKPDFATFTSSSTIRNFVELAGAAALDGVRVVSIGPVTSATARSLGIEIAAEASPYTMAGVVEAIVRMCDR